MKKLKKPSKEFIKEKGKRYEVDIEVKFTQVEYAKSKKLAIQQVKYTFADEYNLDLSDDEITSVRT